MKQSSHSEPSKWALRSFRWFCHPECREDIEGDLLERFEKRSEDRGIRKARWLFIKDVIQLLRPGIIKSISGTQKFNNMGMFKNYITTSFRFIKREKVYTAMNISGLALGIGCALVIYRIIDHELSYDTHHKNYNKIYRVINEDVNSNNVDHWPGQVHPLGEALRNDFPGLTATMTFYDGSGLVTIEGKNGNLKKFKEEEGVVFVEPQFFDLFDFNFLSGNPKTALADPGHVVLTTSSAQKYFGLSEEAVNEAMGQSLRLENERSFIVTGVISDIPKSTDFPFEVLFNYKDQGVVNPWYGNGDDWGDYNSSTNCYVYLPEEESALSWEIQLENFVKKYLPEETAQKRKYRLQPLSDLHSSELVTHNYGGVTVSNNKLLALGAVGLFLIITACINFINLSTAQSVKRSKEIGIRKTLGSSRLQLIMQFLTETVLVSTMASIGGLIVASLLFYYLGDAVGYELDLNLTSDPRHFLFLGLLTFGIGILAGLYPAMSLARMSATLVSKNSLSGKNSGLFSLRRGLVIFQFVISQMLIIGTLVVHLQMEHFLTKDLGFNGKSILTMELPDSDPEKLKLLKTNLLSHSKIEQVSFATSSPLADWRVNNGIYHPAIDHDDRFGNLKNVDEDYLDLYQLELIAGQNYRNDDPKEYAVVNRKLTKLLGFENPADAVGEKFDYGQGPLPFRIVGVVEDFHSGPLHEELEHVIFANLPFNIFKVGIKFNGQQSSYADLSELVSFTEEKWLEAYPAHVFDYSFYDEEMAGLYEIEDRIASTFQLFAFIAIFIGCMGLYGLVSFMSNQKTKEIGIRKVLGASVLNILKIFSNEMVVLLFIAFLIAGPLGYLSMNSWLEEFAYRIDLQPNVFVISILISVTIALLTIGYRSIKASIANPVDSLRNE